LHGLPGGRILVGETPLQTAHRILKDKCNIIPTTISLTSMTTEHTTHKSKIIGTHIIFLFKATTKNPALQVVDKKTMIASDYQLLGTNQKKDEVLITELLDV
jgi:ADP-ribose pyrophosphatase YjhB (NUDIX family)